MKNKNKPTEKTKAKYHDNFAIIKAVDDTKASLVRLQADRHGDYRGVIQNNFALDNPEHVSVPLADIISVFPNGVPRYGKAYGIDIEPLVAVTKIKPFGRVAFFRQLSETEEKALTRGLTKTFDTFIQPNKLKHLLPVQLEIRNNSGKMHGYYKRDKKSEAEPIVCLCPPSFIDETKTVVPRILAHELSHELWDLYLPDEIKARWIKLYHSFATIKDFGKEELRTQWKDLIDSGTLVSEYRKQLEESQRLFFDCSLKWIKTSTRLSIKDLDLLRKNGDVLDQIWPSKNVHLTELLTPVTRYASKSATELFCESLSLYAIGEQLPKAVRKLVARSLKAKS